MTLHDSVASAESRLIAAKRSYAMSGRRDPKEKQYDIEIPEAIASWRFMLDCRKSAFDRLAGLPHKKYGAADPYEFEPERFLAAQAYLSVNWALCDSITSWVGKALCYGGKAHTERSSLKLPGLSTFIPERLAVGIIDDFGYAVALSYQIRNCFVHDGGVGFFRGPDQQSGLSISEGRWQDLQKCPEVKGSFQKRRNAVRLDDAERDLGVVLAWCETETDEALGTLLVSACALIGGHLGFAASTAV